MGNNTVGRVFYNLFTCLGDPIGENSTIDDKIKIDQFNTNYSNIEKKLKELFECYFDLDKKNSLFNQINIYKLNKYISDFKNLLDNENQDLTGEIFLSQKEKIENLKKVFLIYKSILSEDLNFKNNDNIFNTFENIENLNLNNFDKINESIFNLIKIKDDIKIKILNNNSNYTIYYLFFYIELIFKNLECQIDNDVNYFENPTNIEYFIGFFTISHKSVIGISQKDIGPFK